MADPNFAGNGSYNGYTPVQIFAGESDIVTTSGIVKQGQTLAAFTVLAKDVNNKLVPYNPAAADVAVTGGATSQTAKAPETKAVGILASAIDTSSGGLNADTSVAYYRGGVFNAAALVWPAGANTLALQKAAFDRTDITIEAVLP